MPISLSSRGGPLCLQDGQTYAQHLQTPVRVRVRCGLVWLTVEEGGADVWLSPGRDFDFHGRGLAVFEAVKGCAEFEILARPGWWSRIAEVYWRPARLDGGTTAPGGRCAGQAEAGTRISRLLPRGLIRWF